MPSANSAVILRELLKPQNQRFAPRSAGFVKTNCSTCVRAPQHSCLQSSARMWHWGEQSSVSESKAVAAFGPSFPPLTVSQRCITKSLFLPALCTKLCCLSPAPGRAPGKLGCCLMLP